MSLQASNFAFLSDHDALLAQLGQHAEAYFTQDPNTTLFKLRQFGEVLSQSVAARMGLYGTSSEKQFDRINRLYDEGILSAELQQLFHGIRKAGNAAVHEGTGEHGEALHQLKMARKLAIWFAQSFGAGVDFHPGAFVPPPDPEHHSQALADELEQLRQQYQESQDAARLAQSSLQQKSLESAVWEKFANDMEDAKLELDRQLEALTQQLEALQSQAQERPEAETQALFQRVNAASQAVELTEAETRRLIDQQLEAAGWEADSQELTHAQGARPQKGQNRAIAEWPVEGGRADYVLFAGLVALAVVEAKRKQTDVPGALEQAKRYSRDFAVLDQEQPPPGGPWDGYQIPFLFATNGRPFLRQLHTKSGIWFIDKRHPENTARPLADWWTPEGLLGLLKQDHHKAHQRLDQEPTGYLGLRPYQLEAIAAVEQALREGRRECLLAMATGTGKTRTCIGLIYRLLKTRRLRRVLFLVDRTALGVQAANAFKETPLEGLQTFADIFDLKELHHTEPDDDTRLHIATVQGMVKRIMYPAQEDHIPPIDQYDGIVVDESHRGYNLDREMSDDELLFRDQSSYISKYRRVLEHFDAVKIGLTATPALHTSQIFGKPVYQYSYRDAVIDGFLVDYDPPIQIVTALAEDGIHWQAGEEVMVYQTRTGDVELEELEDEVSLDIDAFNTKVLVEGFNRAVCGELARHIDPKDPGKTLIFCATDAHADSIVALLKEALQQHYGSVQDDAVVKITGASDQPLKLLRRYRNEKLPAIAATVDLLTTGVDVPSICNLVFLRRVKSRILYEQMLGRATRLCEDIGKESFRIFDAVKLYQALEAFTAMKPVVTRPSIPFTQLREELAAQVEPRLLRVIQEQFVAKLQRKRRHIQGEDAELFEAAAQIPLDAFVELAHDQSPEELKAWLDQHPGVCEFLDKATRPQPRRLYIAQGEDQVTAVFEGYGDGAQRPEDYLEGFARFLEQNMNHIPALLTVHQRPSALTREQLKSLKLALDAAGYTEAQLRSAWHKMTNQDIAASILGFIRQQTLREALIPYEQRVDAAIDKILDSHPWTDAQIGWLTKIANQLKANTVVDMPALNSGFFRKQGGFKRLNKEFEGRLEEVLADINEALWAEAS